MNISIRIHSCLKAFLLFLAAIVFFSCSNEKLRLRYDPMLRKVVCMSPGYGIHSISFSHNGANGKTEGGTIFFDSLRQSVDLINPAEDRLEGDSLDSLIKTPDLKLFVLLRNQNVQVPLAKNVIIFKPNEAQGKEHIFESR